MIKLFFHHLIIRFEFIIPSQFLSLVFNWLPVFILSQIIVFSIAGLYKRLWRYSSLFDLYDILTAVTISSLLSFSIILVFMGTEVYPRSVLLLFFLGQANYFLEH